MASQDKKLTVSFVVMNEIGSDCFFLLLIWPVQTSHERDKIENTVKMFSESER